MELYNIEKMQEERREIQRFCEDQRRALEQLKRQMEAAHWNDANRDRTVALMNEFSHHLSAILAVLYQMDSQKVNFFDDLIPLLNAYKDTGAAFDRI